MTSIAIADDHTILRHGLRALLEQEPDFSVVGDAGDGLEAIDLAKHLHPDVLVLDIAMPSMSGIEVAEHVRQEGLQTRIVILSMYANEAYLLDALRNNVDSYILKSETGTMLVQAIRAVMAGKRFLSPSLTERTIEAYLKANNDDDPDAHRESSKLSEREREVVKLIAEGHTNTSIASRLSISQRTVETHRSHVMRKLELTCQADLVRFAIRSGIIK